MTVASRIIDAVAAHPNIAAAELRALMPDIAPRRLRRNLYALLDCGRLQRVRYGHYRIATHDRPPLPVRAATEPLSRLMSGR